MQPKFFQRSCVKYVAPLILTLLTFFILSVPASAASVSQPSPRDVTLRCLTPSIDMSNPQADVIFIHTSVRNSCLRAVTNVSIPWHTVVNCNGTNSLGPSGSWQVSYLGIQQRQSKSQGFSTLCRSNQFPYLLVYYKITGFVYPSATYARGIDATGYASSPSYIFY